MKDFRTMFTIVYGNDYQKASKELGVSVRQLHRYLSANKATKTIHNFLNVIYRGYLPCSGAWAECRILPNGTMETPWGIVSPSDVQLVHRYKWSAVRTQEQLKTLKTRYAKHDETMANIQDKLLELVGEIGVKTAL